MFVGTWKHDGDIDLKVDLASLCWVDCAREGNKMWEEEEDTVVNEEKKWELQVSKWQMNVGLWEEIESTCEEEGEGHDDIKCELCESCKLVWYECSWGMKQ